MRDYLLSLDYRLFAWINSDLSFSGGDVFFPWVTDLGKTLYFRVLVIPLVLFLFVRKFKREGVALFLLLLLAVGVSDFTGGKFKYVPARARPFQNRELHVIQRSDAGSYSFYSNHASNMFTFAAYTSVFMPALAVPLYLTAATVAYSRVYNGVHYPSDVLAGAFMGLFWGLLFAGLAQKLLVFLEKRKASA